MEPLGIDRFNEIVGLPGNDACVDCGAAHPNWASVNNGVLICVNCAGVHRGLGVKISFVKSLDLDQWSALEVRKVTSSSNEFVNSFFLENQETVSGQERYLSEAGGLLRAVLKALLDGAAPPTKLEESERQLLEEERRGFLHRQQNVNGSGGQSIARPWIPDAEAENCMICSKRFSLWLRLHHCRACGRCCCSRCAPADNTKPIPQLGYREPVRHCKQCFKSAHVKFV